MDLNWIEDDGYTQIRGVVGDLRVWYGVTTDPELTPPFTVWRTITADVSAFGDPFSFLLRFTPAGKPVKYTDAIRYTPSHTYPDTPQVFSYDSPSVTVANMDELVNHIDQDYAALTARVREVEDQLGIRRPGDVPHSDRM